ncbi:MAG: undecaprenyldiphospho-muramoylpentapeptide beta-N-acetylglucosaminyltransferase [Nitrospirae bacterium]|nr:undecaprenyldiphospho-muramoylpentapeptide beta-N-acetylglucosaminyltransferase [Nitrospirota bacterium]MBI3351247.1 undecaprenyldiphospho-muramoylpentapeptide beta-N-acetylglucosaminyltransferase [Nitrospirota bacterium]
MKIVIAGGGTGGHLYPGIALAKAFQNYFKGVQILFIGTEKGIESRVLPGEGFTLKTIEVEGWIGKNRMTLLKTLIRFPKSLGQSYRLLKAFRPNLVIGVGGYASGPVLLVAAFLKIKRIILEQNVIPGLTNKILGHWVHQVFGSFEGSKAYFPRKKFFFSGNPVRKEIINIRAGKESGELTLLVFGGSQGAHAINQAVVDALDILKKDPRLSIQWIHQTGPKDFQWVKEQYEAKKISARVEPFIFNMAQAYETSDLVICRAGATTLAELTACGKPAILIPFPFAAHRHQEKNAYFFKKMGAAEVIDQADLDGRLLAKKIEGIFLTPNQMNLMAEKAAALGKKDAAEAIIDRCLQLGLGHV